MDGWPHAYAAPAFYHAPVPAAVHPAYAHPHAAARWATPPPRAAAAHHSVPSQHVVAWSSPASTQQSTPPQASRPCAVAPPSPATTASQSTVAQPSAASPPAAVLVTCGAPLLPAEAPPMPEARAAPPAAARRPQPCAARARSPEEAMERKMRAMRRAALQAKLPRICKRLQAAAYTKGGINWEKTFQRHDKSNDGSLQLHEFRTAVRKELKLTPADLVDSDLSMLFRLIDTNRSGAIDVDELLAFVDKHASADAASGGMGLHSDVLDRMRNRLRMADREQGGVDWERVFGTYDRFGAGGLPLAEFRCVLRRELALTAKDISDASVRAVFESFAASPQSIIGVEQFLAFLAGAPPPAAPAAYSTPPHARRGADVGASTPQADAPLAQGPCRRGGDERSWRTPPRSRSASPGRGGRLAAAARPPASPHTPPRGVVARTLYQAASSPPSPQVQRQASTGDKGPLLEEAGAAAAPPERHPLLRPVEAAPVPGADAGGAAPRAAAELTGAAEDRDASADTVVLNVGGRETVEVLLSTLRLFRGSRLEQMFAAGWQARLPRDRAGRVFVDSAPELFIPLIDVLREYRLLQELGAQDAPPLPSFAGRAQAAAFRRTLRYFGLERALAAKSGPRAGAAAETAAGASASRGCAATRSGDADVQDRPSRPRSRLPTPTGRDRGEEAAARGPAAQPGSRGELPPAGGEETLDSGAGPATGAGPLPPPSADESRPLALSASVDESRHETADAAAKALENLHRLLTTSPTQRGRSRRDASGSVGGSGAIGLGTGGGGPATTPVARMAHGLGYARPGATADGAPRGGAAGGLGRG